MHGEEASGRIILDDRQKRKGPWFGLAAAGKPLSQRGIPEGRGPTCLGRYVAPLPAEELSSELAVGTPDPPSRGGGPLLVEAQQCAAIRALVDQVEGRQLQGLPFLGEDLDNDQPIACQPAIIGLQRQQRS
jgi:hypothetical protein